MVKLDALPSLHPPAILPSIRQRLNDHVQCPLPRKPNDPPARAIRVNSSGLIVVPRMNRNRRRAVTELSAPISRELAPTADFEDREAEGRGWWTADLTWVDRRDRPFLPPAVLV